MEICFFHKTFVLVKTEIVTALTTCSDSPSHWMQSVERGIEQASFVIPWSLLANDVKEKTGKCEFPASP